jgi:hypothetical protein
LLKLSIERWITAAESAERNTVKIATDNRSGLPRAGYAPGITVVVLSPIPFHEGAKADVACWPLADVRWSLAGRRLTEQ